MANLRHVFESRISLNQFLKNAKMENFYKKTTKITKTHTFQCEFSIFMHLLQIDLDAF